MLKAIFFDNDGVLVDTEKWFFRATKEIMAECGFILEESNFVEFFLKQNTGLWHVLDGVKLGELNVDELRLWRDELFMHYICTEDIAIPGVGELLDLLSKKNVNLGDKKLIIGVVTSSKLNHFNAIHARTGFGKYFDFVLSREDYQHTKPNPEPYLCALKKSGCATKDVLVIEDSPRGVDAALAAGLMCLVVPSQFTHTIKFPDRAKKIMDWSEVMDWVCSCGD